MAPFTDDNLRDLREFWIHKGANSSCDCMTSDEAEGLLARLEAAEKVCEALRRYLVNQDHEDFDLALIAWRKSCGK